ncbi:hypothetical protein ITX49_14795 [Enterococcus casseliflavus]|uniref:hypothetical protein n=1 Tax=Enterococcus TaxID=1350 RepID=UPI001CBF0EC5|nr:MULTISPECIES: hypothetical protein [Enterococcus]MBZ3642448.1 hypothetical protein [Enterococcus casseliflavus]MCD5185879.1 hypothetical protein [Enterococcus gallinarum]
MEVHLFLDEDGFCEGWGSNEEVNSVPYEIEDDEVLRGIMKYRYENGELIYDETKALINAKESRKYKAKRKSNELLAQGFTITIADVQYTYPYDEDSKAYLNKVYELSTSGLIDNAAFILLKGNEEVSLTVDKVNITELWLLSFLHEEDLKKTLTEKLQQIESAESIKDLQEIE